jgi:L-aspartate oxidase
VRPSSPVRGDFLVIGSGIAGLRAALTLAGIGDVVVVTKSDRQESNTGYAQGGIAAAIGPDDAPGLHGRDTEAAGDGLCRPEAVAVLVTEGPRYVRELVAWGAAFDLDATGQPALAREAAHSVRRVLHARDATGREIARTLWARVDGHPRITVLEGAQALDLRVADGRCRGAGIVQAGRLSAIEAARTLIATGGAGQVFRETTNPAIATGDGIAMAARAGARVADLEFVQFHPTVLDVPGHPRFLLSEALRGEGGRLVNAAGEAFMSRREPAGDLASRDLVARAIVAEMERTGGRVFLSMAHLDADFVRARFPTIARACREAGLDLGTDPIPVSPAAHYVMGGVETDLDGRTSIEGLFAAGEAACTGVHGANRLASNSLLEGLVFGARAASAMAGPVVPAALFCEPAPASEPGGAGRDGMPDEAGIRDLVWRAAGIIRRRDTLEAAVVRLARWRRAAEREIAAHPGDSARQRVVTLATVGLLVARAALRREESRGGHHRADFPRRDDLHWRKHCADRL